MQVEALKLALEAFEYTGLKWPQVEEAITAIKAALEAKDEPVQNQLMALIDENQRLRVELKFNTNSPQRTWVGLTDEERYELLSKADWAHDPESYAVLVETKLKEKNT